MATAMIDKTKSPAEPARIALIEPVARTRDVLRRTLRRLGHVPVPFDGLDAFRSSTQGHRQCALALVAGTGDPPSTEALLRAVKALSARGTGLVLMVPRRGTGLLPMHARVDDFVVAAPVSLPTLYPRLRSVLMRQGLRPLDDDFLYGPYRFSPQTGIVRFEGEEIRLQPLEFDLAMEFFRHCDRTLSREWLYSMVWESDQLQERALDTQVSRLRAKLGLHTSEGWSLQCVPRQGYRLASPLCTAPPALQAARAAWRSGIRAWPGNAMAA